MIRIGTLQDSLANRRGITTADGTSYFKSDFILSTEEDAIAPQAFLVEQEANSTIRPHFHMENQFQVVVDGSAKLGAHPVGPVSVHYASKHTGYGPIVSGDQGLSYFSIRDRVTALAYYLPESRDQMADLPRRNLFAERLQVLDEQALRALGTTQSHEMFAPQADGVSAWNVLVPAGSRVSLPLPAGGADRFHMVLAGAVRREGKDLSRLATVFTSADEQPLELQAADPGAQVLVLQFPARKAS